MMILMITSQEDFRKISDEEFDIYILVSSIRFIEWNEMLKKILPCFDIVFGL